MKRKYYKFIHKKKFLVPDHTERHATSRQEGEGVAGMASLVLPANLSGR
jgi:hypothetical protein